VKLLACNDLHLASKGPSTRIDDWHATVERKLDFIEATAARHSVDAIAIAGDLFHKDTLAYQSGVWAPMTQVISRFKRWSERWPVLVDVGNHDMVHNRIDLLDKTAFGVLRAAGYITPVWDEPYVHEDGSWVGAVPYPVTETAVRQWAERPGPGFLMLHCFASLNGGDYFGETGLAYMDLVQWLPNVRVFHFGHDHKDHGVQVLGSQVFVQVGSLMRGTLADDQIDREPAVVIVDTLDPAEWVKVLVPIEPADTVFDLSQKTQTLEETSQVEQYVGHLAEATAAVGDVDVMALVGALPVSTEAVRNLVKQYLVTGART
jgi:hypothetical protein